ncbi:hypothetical protein B0H14DRAFT_2606950 [Mycena olivaceomarginata]|nr:hypothetical protein B0H14DRAFT_2606950 [Mycena olivaceomarginata]
MHSRETGAMVFSWADVPSPIAWSIPWLSSSRTARPVCTPRPPRPPRPLVPPRICPPRPLEAGGFGIGGAFDIGRECGKSLGVKEDAAGGPMMEFMSGAIRPDGGVIESGVWTNPSGDGAGTVAEDDRAKPPGLGVCVAGAAGAPRGEREDKAGAAGGCEGPVGVAGAARAPRAEGDAEAGAAGRREGPVGVAGDARVPCAEGEDEAGASPEAGPAGRREGPVGVASTARVPRAEGEDEAGASPEAGAAGRREGPVGVASAAKVPRAEGEDEAGAAGGREGIAGGPAVPDPAAY